MDVKQLFKFKETNKPYRTLIVSADSRIEADKELRSLIESLNKTSLIPYNVIDFRFIKDE